MKKMTLVALLILIIGSAVCIYFIVTTRTDKNKRAAATTVEESVTYTFNELGLTIDVPNNLSVTTNPIQNIDNPNKLDSYLFYIQYPNKDAAINSTADFQIYGIFQFGLPNITLDQFNEIKNDTNTYAYTNEVSINGIRGFEGKFNGERGNYFYQFFLDGQILKISISPSTVENKMFAEKIIRSIKLIK